MPSPWCAANRLHVPLVRFLITCFAMDKRADEIQKLPHSTIIAKAVAQVPSFLLVGCSTPVVVATSTDTRMWLAG